MTPEQERARARAAARARVQQMQDARTRSGDPMTPGSVGGAIAGHAASRAAPTDQERQRLAQSAAQRDTLRRVLPFGIGNLAVPIANTIADPDRRAGVGRATQSFGRDLAQIPNLDAGRLAADTGRAVQQGVRDLPSTLARIPGQLPAIGRAITYGPFVDEERNQREVELARMRGMPNAAAQAADEANANTVSAGLNAAGPAIGGGGTVLRAGATGAALTAPFALSRNAEQPLQERLPGAVTETLGGAAFGAGAQGLANGLPRIAPSRGNVRAADFEAAGVRPTLAAVNQGASAAATKMIGENLFAGPAVRSRLQASLDDTAAAASRLAGEAGEVAPREIVGEGVQQGVRNFAQNRNMPNPRPGMAPRSVPVNEWSFPAKAQALYSDVFDRLGADEAAMVGQVDGPLLSLDATQEALGQIRGRVSGPASREVMASPMIERMASALTDDAAAGALRFQDLRAWRTWVREAQRNEGLRQGLDNAALQRLESALTQDLYASAMLIGGRAADDLRVIDRWYRRNTQMINTALEPFAQGGGAQAYRRMIDLASQGGRQNSRQLEQALRVLPRDVRRSLSATIIDELGKPSFGAPNALEAGAFRVDRFVTNYARLSPEGRRAIFGALTEQLDTLARVAGYQKGVEAMANSSRSSISVQNVGAAGGVLNPSTTAPTVALLGAMAITGEMLTNPAFVRWLTSAPRNGGSAGMRVHLAELRRLAARDPALAPMLAELQARAEAEQSQRAPASNGGPAGMPPQREPAFQ